MGTKGALPHGCKWRFQGILDYREKGPWRGYRRQEAAWCREATNHLQTIWRCKKLDWKWGHGAPALQTGTALQRPSVSLKSKSFVLEGSKCVLTIKAPAWIRTGLETCRIGQEGFSVEKEFNVIIASDLSFHQGTIEWIGHRAPHHRNYSVPICIIVSRNHLSLFLN